MVNFMRLAILADIHGNLPALEAVLVELERLQPDYVVLNGDLVNAVPFSTDVVDFVRATDWVVVRGNHEFYFLDYGTERAADGCEDPVRWGQLHWLVERLSPEQGAYLAMLPDERRLYLPGTGPICVAHGVPGRNRTGFYAEQADGDVAADLAEIPQRTVISAHTHVQVDRHVYWPPPRAADLYAGPHHDIDIYHGHENHSGASTGAGKAGRHVHHWHVINPGSVGLPLNGEPAAQFALVESVDEQVEAGGWQATHYRIPYDRRPALAAYAETGMLEAGGIITRLFYWELVTAEPEIVLFYRWARENGYDAELAIEKSFAAYVEQTGRADYVRQQDPLFQAQGR
jgi:predicted phosphodiesterase